MKTPRKAAHKAVSLLVLMLFVLSKDALAQDTRPQTTSTPATGSLTRLINARPRIDKTLTIEEAVTIALKESPVIRGAVAEVEATSGRRESSLAQTRPAISANTFVSGGSNSSIVPSPGTVPPAMLMAVPRNGFVDQNLAVMYPLYTSGRLEALVRQSTALHAASEADRETQRQEIILLVRTTYHDVQTRQALVLVAEARLKENEERLRLDRIRLQQEQIPAYFVTRDEAEVAEATQQVTNSQRDTEIVLSQLKMALGVHPDSQLTVVAASPEVPSLDTVIMGMTKGAADLTALRTVAETHRPELMASAQRVQGAEAGVDGVRSNYHPQVNLFGMADVLKANGQKAFTGVTYGVAASIPLYNGGQQRADIRTAAAMRQQEEQQQERIALQVAQEVDIALITLRAARQQVDTAHAALTAAEDAYRVVRLRYEAGRSIVTELLDAQALLIRAEINRLQMRLEFEVAADRLSRAVGTIH